MIANDAERGLWALGDGGWTLEWDLGWTGADVSGACVAFHRDEDAIYVLGAIDESVCFFDDGRAECFEETLPFKPDFGVTLGDRYYYGADIGNGGDFGVVEDIFGDEPDFWAADFEMDETIFDGALRAVVAVDEATDENGVEVYVDDGVNDGRYLVGLSEDLKVVVIRISDADSPDEYAIIDANMDWRGETASNEVTVGGGFVLSDGGGRAFFLASDGTGVFELLFPIEVPDDCWYDGSDADLCEDGAASVARYADAAQFDVSSSLSCPDASFASSPSSAPVLEPTLIPTVFYATVDPFDCDERFDPVQVLRRDDDEFYEVVELDAATGDYETVYELDYLDLNTHVNAVALVQVGQTYHALGSIDGYLCLFDETHTKCFETALEESKPNVGAVLDDHYYYAKDLGDSGERRVYWVEGIQSELTFHSHEAARFAVKDDLFSSEVLDFAAFKETSNDFIDDGEAARYLVGLAQQFEVFVIRLADDGYPDASFRGAGLFSPTNRGDAATFRGDEAPATATVRGRL